MPSIEIEDVRREVERGDCKEKKKSRLGLRSYTHGQWSVRVNLNLLAIRINKRHHFFLYESSPRGLIFGVFLWTIDQREDLEPISA